MTDHLIAKRNRVRDMLLDQENDPWLIYKEEELRDVLSDDNLALLNIEVLHSREIRKLELDSVLNGRKWSDLFPHALKYNAAIGAARTTVGNARNKLVYWNEKLEEAQHKIDIFNNDILEANKAVARSWGELSDRERAFFGRTPVNPIGVYDFPLRDEYGLERAAFYPEPVIMHQAQTAKLRHALEMVERALVEEVNKA